MKITEAYPEKRCHNCGFSSDYGRIEGRNVVLRARAENKFRKDSRRTVWPIASPLREWFEGSRKKASFTP